MTVLPDAPIDQASGLPVPTIAVATDGGVSVIKDDGTVVDITSGFGAEMDYYHISFDDQNRLHFTNRLDSTYPVVFNAVPSSDVSVSTADVVYGITGSGFTPNTGIYLPSNVGEIDSYLPIAAAGANGLFPLSTNFSSPPKSMQATVNSTYNTGWMPGAIKGAFLSDTNDTDLVGSINFSSTFSSWTGDDPDEFSVIGTEDTNNFVTEVASGARIVSDGSLFGLQVIDFNHLTKGKQYIVKFVKSGHASGEIRFGTSGNLNTISGSDCASSDNLGHLSGFPFGGSGSSLIEFMRFQFGGASAA